MGILYLIQIFSLSGLSVTQYRDVNIANGREALFGLFDGGPRNIVPKSISKSIAKLYAEERNIEESLKLSLKYTLLNSLRSFPTFLQIMAKSLFFFYNL
jgi:hypothetical protein